MTGDVDRRSELARTVGRNRVLLAVGLVALVVVVVLVLRGSGSDEPPVDAAVKLVPETALVYAHVSTDGDREATGRAGDLLARFGPYTTQRDALLQRLSGGDRPVDVERDVEPWLGDEAALALTDDGTGTAGSLIVLQVTDEQKARAFLGRNPRRPEVRQYKTEELSLYGTVAVAFKDGFLLVGQDRSVQGAMDRANGRGRSLDEVPVYRRATRALPAGRAGDVYASADGLRRLLVPQGGVVGGLASLLDRPGLEATAVSMEAVDGGAKVVARSTLVRGRRRPAPRPFDPELAGGVPADALAYFGVNGISDALTRLVTTAAGGAQAGGIAPLLERLRTQLDKESGGRLQRDLLDLLRQEVALVVTRSTPAPIISLITKASSEGSTRETLRRLQAPLARLLTPQGEQAPAWRAEDFGGGTRGATLATPAGASLSYAVFDGRLVVSTSPEGVRRIKSVESPIEDATSFQDVLSERPDRVGSLGFLNFSQLLELGEQTGLNDSRAYLAARDDLQQIRAVGVHSTGSEDETTAEILLSIP